MKIALCGYRQISRVREILVALEAADVSESVAEALGEAVGSKPYLEVCVESERSVVPILEQLSHSGIREELKFTGAVAIVFSAGDLEGAGWREKWQEYCLKHSKVG
ncbi:hypothetical protein EPO05_02685 [Patescibacteria group bacterium]|nr:MAG: hypothetical protein EPO05_02685 [Patescibacteria group bacterium]